MAIPLAAKAAAFVLGDERGRRAVGWIIVACLSPLLLVAAILCCLGAATADHNSAAVNLCFHGGVTPASMPTEYREQIAMTQASFGRLEAAISAAEVDMENGDSLDYTRVKAIFFSLFFGRESYSQRSCAAFARCFYAEEERTRTVTNEDGNEGEETYIVHIPINNLSTVYANIAGIFGVDISMEDKLNASEIYNRVRYGASGSGADWINGIPLSDAPFIGADGFCSPLGENWRGLVTSEFGWRSDPLTGQGRGHAGLDMGAPKGSSIRAALDGVVYFVSYSSGGYGYHLGIDHGGGFVTLYAHCSEILVAEGQEVKAGDIIAKVGSTGRSTGPHLHFEVRINGEAQNPRGYLP